MRWVTAMRSEEVTGILARHRDELARLGVASLSLFGSTVRDEAGPDSDVDLLVEFNHPIGLFHFAEVTLRLEEMLGRTVDLVMPTALKPRVRERVLREAVRAI